MDTKERWSLPAFYPSLSAAILTMQVCLRQAMPYFNMVVIPGVQQFGAQPRLLHIVKAFCTDFLKKFDADRQFYECFQFLSPFPHKAVRG